MATYRDRDGRVQAIIRIKRGGVIVHQESQTFSSRERAEAWADRTEARIRKDGVEARKTAKTTLADMLTAYRKMRTAVKPLGRSTEYDLDMFERMLGDVPVDSLSSTVWTKFAQRRRSAGASPATLLHNLSVIRGVLNAARPLLGIDVDAESLKDTLAQLSVNGFIGKSASRDRRTSDAEIDALVQEFRRIAAYPSTVIPMHVIVPLAVAFPRRMGELCDMQWADYNAGIVTLRDTKHPQALRTENVPVPPKAQALIAELPRFDARMLPYKPDSVSAAFTRACERLKIHDLRFHDLRHEGICRLFESGLGIPEVALVSGHMTWTALKRYTHLTPSHVLEKMNEVA